MGVVSTEFSWMLSQRRLRESSQAGQGLARAGSAEGERTLGHSDKYGREVKTALCAADPRGRQAYRVQRTQTHSSGSTQDHPRCARAREDQDYEDVSMLYYSRISGVTSRYRRLRRQSHAATDPDPACTHHA